MIKYTIWSVLDTVANPGLVEEGSELPLHHLLALLLPALSALLSQCPQLQSEHSVCNIYLSTKKSYSNV